MSAVALLLADVTTASASAKSVLDQAIQRQMVSLMEVVADIEDE